MCLCFCLGACRVSFVLVQAACAFVFGGACRVLTYPCGLCLLQYCTRTHTHVDTHMRMHMHTHAPTHTYTSTNAIGLAGRNVAQPTMVAQHLFTVFSVRDGHHRQTERMKRKTSGMAPRETPKEGCRGQRRRPSAVSSPPPPPPRPCPPLASSLC